MIDDDGNAFHTSARSRKKGRASRVFLDGTWRALYSASTLAPASLIHPCETNEIEGIVLTTLMGF